MEHGTLQISPYLTATDHESDVNKPTIKSTMNNKNSSADGQSSSEESNNTNIGGYNAGNQGT
jgi:hypothetical protein